MSGDTIKRNTSDKSSAYAALVSNINEKDRAKDVEQFDDVLRAFKNEMMQVCPVRDL